MDRLHPMGFERFLVTVSRKIRKVAIREENAQKLGQTWGAR